MPSARRRRCLQAFAAALAAVAAIGVAGSSGIAAPGDGSGTLLAFGLNQYGALGSTANNLSTSPNPTPAAVALPGEIGTVATAAAGAYHSLVVTSSGQLYGFGYNYSGELGTATGNITNNANPAPTLVTLPGQVGTVTAVAGGNDDSFALTSSGQLYGFGSNADGQLGNTTNVSNSLVANPTPTPIALPGQVGPVTLIAAGAYHTLAATASGQLYAFGFNFYGQLGNTTNANMTNPNPTPTLVTLPGQVGTIAEIAGGLHNSLVLTSSGQLYSFGYNLYGQLGTTTGVGGITANPTPGLVTLPGLVGSISHIAAGFDHSLVTTTSGQLYAFGRNNYGQLGIAANSGTDTPNPTPALVTLPGEVGPVTQVAAGAGHSLAVTASGQLYAFGRNEYGELGSTTNNTPATANATPALVALPAGTTIATLAKGSQAAHSLALVSNLAIATSALASAHVGTPYAAILQGAGGTAPLNWSASGLPAGLTIDGAAGAISGTPTAGGTFSVTATLTDALGSSVSQTFALDVIAPAAPPALKAPKLTTAKQSAGKWLLGSKLARLVNAVTPPVKRNGVPIGTTFTFAVDQAARVTLTFTHAAQGRKVSGKCVATTKRNAGKPHCTRTLGDGTLSVKAKAGTNRLHFEGRVSSTRKLKTGLHRVVIAAINSAGKTSKSLRFTIAAG